MLYSYIRQQVIVFNPAYDYAYVYSLTDKAWGMIPSDITSRVESYPEALANVRGGALVDYAGKGNVFPQLVVTRPLKLDDPDVLKTVSAAIQRGHFACSHLNCVLLGSRNIFDWFLVRTAKGRRLTNFFGTPYKYFRLVLIGTLGRDESISSVSAEFQPRLTDRIR